ncbi:ankyrin repeat domain-containing protein [Aspergillus aculeatinus CBS 121060]|uniref:Ankyrin n=1 Tax=Aspergillus aculeatinus CBS 121060 TaxID=1448322 RepID=A0ACD1H1A7_9EURO|nr:ankyrin [Aspergillus aculeatinus CBS 121060]RAH67380.1 ankyrin [Aspergillus aculeatinus CBS 121060]
MAVRTACGPLLELCEDGVVQIIHNSLTGADLEAKSNRGRTALHYAAEAGQSAALGLLIDAYRSQSLPIDGQTVRGRTALHEAAKSDRYESVKLLVDAGSRPDICDWRGRTPLHTAAEFEAICRSQKNESNDDWTVRLNSKQSIAGKRARA